MCLILCSKFAKNRLSAGFRPDPLEELTALPRPLAGSRWKGAGKEDGMAREAGKGMGGKVRGERREGEGRGGKARGLGWVSPSNENPGYGLANGCNAIVITKSCWLSKTDKTRSCRNTRNHVYGGHACKITNVFETTFLDCCHTNRHVEINTSFRYRGWWKLTGGSTWPKRRSASTSIISRHANETLRESVKRGQRFCATPLLCTV